MHVIVISVATPLCFFKNQELWPGIWATRILFLALTLILYNLKGVPPAKFILCKSLL